MLAATLPAFTTANRLKIGARGRNKFGHVMEMAGDWTEGFPGVVSRWNCRAGYQDSPMRKMLLEVDDLSTAAFGSTKSVSKQVMAVEFCRSKLANPKRPNETVAAPESDSVMTPWRCLKVAQRSSVADCEVQGCQGPRILGMDSKRLVNPLGMVGRSLKYDPHHRPSVLSSGFSGRRSRSHRLLRRSSLGSLLCLRRGLLDGSFLAACFLLLSLGCTERFPTLAGCFGDGLLTFSRHLPSLTFRGCGRDGFGWFGFPTCFCPRRSWAALIRSMASGENFRRLPGAGSAVVFAAAAEVLRTPGSMERNSAICSSKFRLRSSSPSTAAEIISADNVGGIILYFPRLLCLGPDPILHH